MGVMLQSVFWWMKVNNSFANWTDFIDKVKERFGTIYIKNTQIESTIEEVLIEKRIK